MPIPVTSLDAKFLDHIEKMEDVSRGVDLGLTMIDQRMWMFPPGDPMYDGDPRNLVDMAIVFDRDDLNDQYIEVIDDTDQVSTIGEAMISKLQIDYIASCERAFRTRHCSSIRAKVHAACRRRAMGDSNGIFSGGVSLWLQRILQAAHDDPTP